MKRIGLLLLLTILSLSLFSQTHWTKYPGNPVFKGDTGDWDDRLNNIASVIFFDDLYHMWYNGVITSGVFKLGYATSPDGINWTKYSGNPVFEDAPSGSWDDTRTKCGDVTLVNDTLHMWYTAEDGEFNFAIGHATSTDGVNWTRDLNNPVFSIEIENDWIYNWIEIHEVTHDGNNYHMWYCAGNYPEEDEVYIGHATSTDGSVWTKDPSNPVLSPGAQGEWDYPMSYFPTVVYDGSIFHMWYAGGGYQGDLLILDIGYASSPDGTIWTKYAGNPVLKRGGAGQDTRSIWSPSVIDSAGVKFKIWYRGDNLEDSSAEQDYSYAETFEPAWKELKPMDISKVAPKSTIIDSMIYIFGGRDINNATLSSCQAYNTSTNEWSDLANMPQDLFGCTADAIGGKIYIIGGYSNDNGNWIPLNSTLEYDPEGDIWQAKTNSPAPKAGMSSCVLNDTIYIFGGNPQDAMKVWYYVPETDNWGTLPDMINERPAASSAEIIDNKIYVIGGTNESGLNNPIGKSEVYDPQSNMWTEMADMQVPVTNHASVVHNQKILVFGGDSLFNLAAGTSAGINIIQQYDPSTDSWSFLKPMPFNLAGMAGEKVDNFVYLIGGYSNNWNQDALSEVWRYNLDSLEEWVVPCSEVLISQITLAMERGETHLLSAGVLPTYAADRTVVWSTSNEDIASVSPDGNVTATAGGTVTIFASSNDGACTASCEVTVTVSVTGVSLDQHTLDLDSGQTTTLTADVAPEDATDQSLGWWSGDDAVATVESGVVTANAVGTTYIYVSTIDGGFRDSCQVNVTPGTGGMHYQAKNMISVYPNPVNGFLNIHSSSMEIQQVDISSVSGQILQSFNMDRTNVQLNLSSFRKGVYFITIRSKDFVTTRKIIKL